MSAHDLEGTDDSTLHTLLASDCLTAVYQPIYDLRACRIIGFEALSRFSSPFHRTPDYWFSEAARLELSAALEVKALQCQIVALDGLPASLYLSLNVSPDTIVSGELDAVLATVDFERVVLEITEHHLIAEYKDVIRALQPLRERGMRIAVDDAGAGYASFRHILKLAPDIIKLDGCLTHNIDTDRAKRALSSALIRFAEEMGSTIISEGVETLSELRILRDLDATMMQGFFLGRPVPLQQALSLCSADVGAGDQSVS